MPEWPCVSEFAKEHYASDSIGRTAEVAAWAERSS